MSTGLVLLCGVTVSVFASVHQLTDESPPTSNESSVTNMTGPRAVPTLRFVVVVTRHSNRAPVVTYPSSPYQWNDTSIWPYGPGELTNSGRVQLYKLGTRFRSLYNGFLSSYYSPSDFRAFSTDIERSLQSAELFLAGLFPPVGYQVWNKDLLWQPVPVYPYSLDHFEMAQPRASRMCPRFNQAKIESFKRLEQNYGSNITDFFKYVIPYTGYKRRRRKALLTPGSLYRLEAIYAMFESFSHPEDEGFPLPAWSKKVYPQPFTFLFSKYAQAVSAASHTQIRYLQGELFQAIVETVRAKINNSLRPDRRMHFYSGHDYTIIGLLSILGLDSPEWFIVKTGSALILEFHSDPVKGDGSFNVQVLYLDGASPHLEPKRVNIPGCESPCDFHLLCNITERYYNITNWHKECQIVTDMHQ